MISWEGGGRQEVKMSDKKILGGSERLSDLWDHTMSAFCLRPQCSYQRLEKDSIVRTSCEALLSGAAEEPRCGAPQEDDLSRSLLWPRFPAHHNDQLCDWAVCRLEFRVLISHPDPALSLIFLTAPVESPLQSSSLLWYFISSSSAFSTSLPSPPQRAGLHLFLSLHTLSSRQAHSPTLLKSTMLPVSAKCGQEGGYAAFQCFES